MKFKKIFLNNKLKRKLMLALALVLIVIIAFVFFTCQIISAVFTLMLIILGCLSSQFKKITGNLDVGIGFIPFTTILFCYTHSIPFALISCFIMMAVSSLLVGQLKVDLFISLGIFAIIGFISMFLNFGIVLNGIILIVIFNILSLVIMTLIGFDIVKNTIYFFGSIFFNYILFKYFSEILYSVLVI